MRRSLVVLLTLLLGAASARATVPTSFSVQGVLRNSTGQLQSMMVNVTIALYDAQTAGTKLAGPFGPSAVMASNGLFTETLTDANLVSELSSAPQVWLEMIVGNDTFPRQRVTPELFAMMAGQADNALQLGGVAASSYVTSSSLTTTLGSYVTQAALTSSLGSYVTQSSLTSTLASYETTSAATGAFQPKGSYEPALTNAACSAGQAYASVSSGGAVTCTNTIANATNATTASALSGILPIANGGTGSSTQNFVDLTSSQTIAGNKTFQSGVYVGTASAQLGQMQVVTPDHASPLASVNSWDNRFLVVGAAGNNGGVGISYDQTNAIGLIGAIKPGSQWVNLALQYGGGLVGIGTISPGYPLDVNGVIRGNNVSVSSDIRLKTNIRTIDHALETVMKLRGVRFDWKKDGTHSIGVIAQEMERVFPEVVSTSPADGMKSVAYGNLVGALIEAVKDLKRGDDAQAAAVARLEKENAALKQRVERLEAAVEKIAAAKTPRSRLAAK